MTTVGAIVGLGLATDALNYETIAWILSWWIFAPIAGFWIGATIGRYIYSDLSRRVQIETSEGPLFVLDHGRGFQSHPSAPTRPGVKSAAQQGSLSSAVIWRSAPAQATSRTPPRHWLVVGH